MTQPAKGQEPSMEEILASIRRIIADEPSEISRNAPPRSAGLHKDGLRNEGARPESRLNEGARRDNLRTEHASYESSDHESPTESMAPDEDGPPAHGPVLPQPPSRLAPLPSRVAPPPPPDPGTAQEELAAMLAELHAGPRRAPDAAEEPASDILDLTEQIAAPESLPAADFAAPDDLAQPDYEEEEASVEVSEEPPPVAQAAGEPHPPMRHEVRSLDHEQERERGRNVAAEHGLISAATTAAVDSAFNTLAQTVLVQNGRTLEDLVREMLRPMLKNWLDDNLPSMVERLVRAEIERVSRGRG